MKRSAFDMAVKIIEAKRRLRLPLPSLRERNNGLSAVIFESFARINGRQLEHAIAKRLAP